MHLPPPSYNLFFRIYRRQKTVRLGIHTVQSIYSTRHLDARSYYKLRSWLGLAIYVSERNPKLWTWHVANTVNCELHFRIYHDVVS
jgi:hypothetical protein